MKCSINVGIFTMGKEYNMGVYQPFIRGLFGYCFIQSPRETLYEFDFLLLMHVIKLHISGVVI